MTKELKTRSLTEAVKYALKLFQKLRVLECCLETTGSIYECVCFTSGQRVRRDKDLHGGHYLLSSKMSTAFEPMNVHAQTKTQNRYLHGNRAIYRQKLIEKYGLDKVELLEFKSRQVKHWTFAELDEMTAEYRKRIKIFEKGGKK